MATRAFLLKNGSDFDKLSLIFREACQSAWFNRRVEVVQNRYQQSHEDNHNGKDEKLLHDPPPIFQPALSTSFFRNEVIQVSKWIQGRSSAS
jgi:hypothetical protein